MEMPFHLRTLPLEALDILRYYGRLGIPLAHADDICEGTGLSERGFGKAIRRLVTKTYLVLDGDQRYRLTDTGRNVVQDLLAAEAAGAIYSTAEMELDDVDAAMEYEWASEAETGAATAEAPAPPRLLERRLIMALPKTLTAGQAVNVFVGFDDAADEMDEPVNLVLELSVLNGEPSQPHQSPFLLGNDAARQVFEVTPGNFTRVRLRLQAFQTGETPDDVWAIGGMYVDADVQPPGAPSDEFVACGTNVRVTALT